MNRRKLFGFLAAAPAAVAAKSGFVTVAHHGDIVPDQPKKWYSAYDYSMIRLLWDKEYVRSKLGLNTGSTIYVSTVEGAFSCYNERGSDDWITVPFLVHIKDMDQAFADACINGEVPGVWCE